MHGEPDCVESAGVVNKINLLRAVAHNIHETSMRIESFLRYLGLADEVNSQQFVASLKSIIDCVQSRAHDGAAAPG